MNRSGLLAGLAVSAWLALSLPAGAERLEGVLLESNPRSLVVRAPDGRRLTVALGSGTRWTKGAGDAARADFRRGDALVLEIRASPPVAVSVADRLTRHREEVESRLAGRVRSLNPSRKELVLEGSEGLTTLKILPGSVVFKDNRVASWLDLHQGETVAALHYGPRKEPSGEWSALVLFDPTSYLIRDYQAQYGELQGMGRVESVTMKSRTEGTLILAEPGTTPLSYDRATRWQLGARFSGPRDFEGVEALIFGPTGNPARMVVSQRAIPFLFEALVRP